MHSRSVNDLFVDWCTKEWWKWNKSTKPAPAPLQNGHQQKELQVIYKIVVFLIIPEIENEMRCNAMQWKA